MKRILLIAFGVLAGALILLLVLTPAASRRTQTPLLSQLKFQAQWTYAELTYKYYVHQFAAQRRAFQKASQSGQAVPIPLPPGQIAEQAIESFASTNRIALFHLQTAGSTVTQVYVWAKDAPAMRTFVNSLTNGANSVPTPQ